MGQNLIKPRQHSCSIVKVPNSASEMKILQDVTDLWTMNITFYKEKLNPLSSLMTGATYWCKKQTAIVLVSDRQRNAASQKLSSPMILALYFIHVWTGVPPVEQINQIKYITCFCLHIFPPGSKIWHVLTSDSDSS